MQLRICRIKGNMGTHYEEEYTSVSLFCNRLDALVEFNRNNLSYLNCFKVSH